MSETTPLPTAEQQTQQVVNLLKPIINPSENIPFDKTHLIPPSSDAPSYTPEQIKNHPKTQLSIEGGQTNLPDFLRENITSLVPPNQLAQIGITDLQNISPEQRLKILQLLIRQPETLVKKLITLGIDPQSLNNPALVVACVQVAALDEAREVISKLSQKTAQKELGKPTDKRRRQIYTIIDAGLDEVTLTGKDMNVVRKKTIETPDGKKIELPDIETTVREDLLAAQQLYNSLVPPQYLLEIVKLEQQMDEANQAGNEEKRSQLAISWLQKRQILYQAILCAFNVVPTDENGNPKPIPFTEQEKEIATQIKQRYQEPISYANFQGQQETRARGSLNAIDANRLATIDILRELGVADEILKNLANPETWETLQMEKHANPKDESFLQNILKLNPNSPNFQLVRRIIIDRLNTNLRLAGLENQIESRFKKKTGDLPENLILPIFHNMGLKGIEFLLRRSETEIVTTEKETPIPLPEEITGARIKLLRQQQGPDERQLIERLEQLAEPNSPPSPAAPPEPQPPPAGETEAPTEPPPPTAEPPAEAGAPVVIEAPAVVVEPVEAPRTIINDKREYSGTEPLTNLAIVDGANVFFKKDQSVRDIKISGGVTNFWGNSSGSNIEISGGEIGFSDNSKATITQITNGEIAMFGFAQVLLLQPSLSLKPEQLKINDQGQLAYLQEGITQETILQTTQVEDIQELQSDQEIAPNPNQPTAFKIGDQTYVIVPTKIKTADKNQEDKPGYAVVRVEKDAKGKDIIWLEKIMAEKDIKDGSQLTLKSGEKITLRPAPQTPAEVPAAAEPPPAAKPPTEAAEEEDTDARKKRRGPSILQRAGSKTRQVFSDLVRKLKKDSPPPQPQRRNRTAI